MTHKTTMPEPVAYQYENPYSKKLTLNLRKTPAGGGQHRQLFRRPI